MFEFSVVFGEILDLNKNLFTCNTCKISMAYVVQNMAAKMAWMKFCPSFKNHKITYKIVILNSS